MRFIQCIVTVCLFVSITATAQQSAKQQLIPVSSEIKKGKLSNGLTYYIRKNTEPKNRAELRLVVNAGSILETDKQVGLAHFTEHMCFNGTQNFKKQELVDFLEKSGVNFGADLNAYTSFDETVYELQVPTDSPMVFKKAMQILEDWSHLVSFDNDEIDKERGVVIEEWRLGRGASGRLRDKYFPVILKGSQYAQRIPIGTKENLDTFHYETVKSFYKDWYRPDLQAVIVVGDINVTEVEKMIKEHFEKIPRRVNAKPRKKFTVPSHAETYTTVLTDPEQTYNVVQVFYNQPEIPEAKTDLEYRSGIVRELFNEMMSNRLQEIAQKPEAPFLFGTCSYDKFIGDKDALTMVAVAKDGKTVRNAVEVLLTENERVKEHGFTATELERAKKAAMSNIENSYNERDKTKSGQFVQELINNYLKGEPIPGVAYEYALYKKYLPTITLAETNKLIAQWIKPTDRSVIVMAPEKEKGNLISDKELLALLNKKMSGTKAYEDKVAAGPLLPVTPVPGTVTAEQKDKDVDAVVWKLSNGATVILKPTDFKNNEISFSATSWGGTSLYSDADYLSASNANAVVLFGGLGNLDIQSLQKQLTGKRVTVYPVMDNYMQGISGSSTPKDLETALQLVYGYFVTPRKDEKMFQVLKQQLQVQLANKSKDPNSVFSDSVTYIMSGYHPRRMPLTTERISEIDLDKAMTIYKDRFANAGQFTFTFVGSFKIDSIRPLIEKYIASLPSKDTKDTYKDIGIQNPKGAIQKTIYKGKENKASVNIIFTGKTTYSDKEETQLQQTCKALAIRLREVLREDQGGVYGVGVDADIKRVPANNYAIIIQFGCSAENAPKLTALVMDEIKSLIANGAPQINIEKVIAEDTRSLENDVKENGYWLYNLENKSIFNEPFKSILDDPMIIKQLTVERSKEIARQYFGENVATFFLLPESK